MNFLKPKSNDHNILLVGKTGSGFGDTRGVMQDDDNITNILETVIPQANLSSVVLVINGSDARLTEDLKYVISCLRSNLPDDLFENTLVVFTNCVEPNFSIESLEIPGVEKEGRNFTMQNSAFGQEYNKIAARAQKQRVTDWNNSMETVDEIIEVISHFHPKSTKSFSEIASARETIAQVLHEIINYIIDSLKVKKVLDRNRGSVENQGSQLIKRMEFEPTEDPNLICMLCNKVCNYGCKLNTTYNRLCSSITLLGKCKKCGCKAKNHYHLRKKLVEKERTLAYLLEEMKQKDTSVVVASTKKKVITLNGEIDGLSAYQNSKDELATTADQVEKISNNIEQKVDSLRVAVIKVKGVCSGYNLNEIDKRLKQIEEKSKETITNENIREDFEKKVKQLKDKIVEIKELYKKPIGEKKE
ncbi:hypothetical protein PPL_11092 [Heterostelium album PN500]|uniref:AIG1-type G domain-containing protein n=1 Tax=Heterostelium pallidum (strain ATCC 26659 / Pp 5 / PN500) TaxID=670386 RepID=D3BSX2_HETP5|nr:hypothetical protein PPL_11092 [Heterostelium album PN500]EFA75587.1 hypothetical protein PPL_11092 [Heterostelium album PN500]|eukprot:XP_020427721.1 hypothetical protein PPL_11092 [Heterostelium album PN500]